MNTPPRFFAAPPPSSPPDAGGDKAALRRAARELRRALKHANPDAAAHAAQALERAFAARAPAAPAAAAVYHARGSELDAWPLAAALERAGALIALPAAVAPGAPLAFRRPEPGAAFEVDASGSPAPGPEARTLRPELVVVPLLAFDDQGARLGQGGGYYDRTLAALRAADPAVRAIGLAYAGQEVARVPMGPHDQRLDGVLTERGLRLFNGG